MPWDNVYENKRILKRFKNKTDDSETLTNCHIWLAAKTKGGYGMFSAYGRSFPAHRVAFMMFNGEIPTGDIVSQTCENPSCVNPEHLITTTKSETRSKFNATRVSPEMIANESVRYLHKLKYFRPELEEQIENLINEINQPQKEINFESFDPFQ